MSSLLIAMMQHTALITIVTAIASHQTAMIAIAIEIAVTIGVKDRADEFRSVLGFLQLPLLSATAGIC